jgi:hypothetical protein
MEADTVWEWEAAWRGRTTLLLFKSRMRSMRTESPGAISPVIATVMLADLLAASVAGVTVALVVEVP